MELSQGPPSMRPPMRGVMGGYRGRGGPPMRGGFDRGRGRGRGHHMGMRGGMGAPPPMGMPPRVGMRGMPPRAMGYHQRGGYMPRGPSMRGSRPPMHIQPPKVHTGAENNKTVTPVNISTVATAGSTEATTKAEIATAQTESTPPAANGPQSVRGSPRGRGVIAVRGRGGSYLSHPNGTVHSEQNGIPIRRGGPTRGRGAYSQGPTRPQIIHTANTQVAPAPANPLKRGAPTGPPGPKRGRYDQTTYSTRQMVPKHQHQHQHQIQVPSHAAPAQHAGYAPHPAPAPRYNNHHIQTHHHNTYQSHEQMQAVDPYAHQQTYSAPPPQQNSYNGYSHTGYATTAQASTAYTQPAEYDQSQYQSYNSSSYAVQPDTRYQTYAQDYTQTYGAPDVDYISPTQDYTQQQTQQTYDERSYAGYDAQGYQNYSTTGYY